MMNLALRYGGQYRDNRNGFPTLGDSGFLHVSLYPYTPARVICPQPVFSVVEPLVLAGQMVTAGDQTWDGEHTIPYTDCRLVPPKRICNLLTNVSPVNSMKKSESACDICEIPNFMFTLCFHGIFRNKTCKPFSEEKTWNQKLSPSIRKKAATTQ